MDVSKSLEALLDAQSPETLAKWWCVLNSWGWPKEIPNQEDRQHSSGGRRTAIMSWISDKVGFRACVRQWNENMTDDEFDAFWRKSFNQQTGVLKI